MSVGESHLDEQHRQLLGEINALLSAMINNESKVIVVRTIGFLDEYITGHLADEERYMQEHNYPDFDAHKQMHEGFIRKYAELKERLAIADPDSVLISDVQTYIGEWWMQHIAKEDRKYADYIRNNT